MKRAVFGHQRSGTSLVYKVMEPFCKPHLGEAFNPSEFRSLYEQGYRLELVDHNERPPSMIQPRESRIELLKKYEEHDYFLKVFPHDLRNPDILEFMKQYRIVAVERADTFDAVLSGLVAMNVWFFNDDGTNTKPAYDQPFTAPWHDFEFMRDAILWYYWYKRMLDIQRVLVYEDVAKLTRQGILDAAGVVNKDGRELPLAKLLTKKDKAALVTNLTEVWEWYQESLFDQLPENRRVNTLDEFT